MAPKKAVVYPKRHELTMEGYLFYSDDHLELFGPGWEHTVYTKAMLIHFEKGLRKFWTNDDGSYKVRVQRPSEGKFEDFFREHFKEITGFQATQAQSFASQVKNVEPKGCLKPRGNKGPEKKKLEEKYKELPNWMEEQVKMASHGSYLTIQRLMEKFKKDFIDTCDGAAGVGPAEAMVGKETFRRALHDMNFEYAKRRVKRLEARESEPVLKQLDEMLEFIVDNHLYGPSKYQPGKMVYSYQPNIRAGAGDESFQNSGEYRDDSWINEKYKMKNFLKRNARLVMAHSIFSGKNKTDDNEWIVEPAIWSTEWKKKREGFKFWGKTNAENLETIYGEAAFALANGAPEGSRNILFLDNCSAHKRIRDELRGTNEDIIDWINSSNEVDTETRQVVLALTTSAAQKGMEVKKQELYQALTSKGIPIHALAALAKKYNGVEIKYLPPYYSELNPIELLWAEVKRVYRDKTNPEDPWEKRMKEAWASITPVFIESCFDRSIRWALKKHKERHDAKKKAAAPAAEPAAPDAEDEAEAADDHEFDELLAEEAIADLEVEFQDPEE